ncbi:MAG TPA: pilin [Candidatus Magasanikbacteria bacterium]|nr:pilin [Candidatus Magasanikbacteria bacterium]
MNRKLKYLLLVLFFSLQFSILGINIVQAQAQTDLRGSIGVQLGNSVSNSQLSTSDPRVVATSIIKVVLGILGVVFLALLFFAGFLWMTSGGDSKKVEKAQQLIKNSIIGLVIILAAYSIVLIVTVYLLRSTTYNQGATYQLPGGYPQY